MSGYNYMEQGDCRFLVYRKSEEEQIDSVVIGQLSGAKPIVPGILPVIRIEINNEIQFRINVTGLISLEEYFTNPVIPSKLLSIYKQLTFTLKEAENYMLDSEVFLLENPYVYISPKNEKVYLAALPVIHKTQSMNDFFRNMLFQNFDDAEDKTLITDLMSVFKSMSFFSLEEFSDRIEKLSGGSRNQKREVHANNDNPVTRAQKVIYAENNHSCSEPDQSNENRPGYRYAERNSNRSRQVQNQEKAENSWEEQQENNGEEKKQKKGPFGFLFGGKKENPPKEKKKKKKSRTSSESEHPFAIPGRDEVNADRRRSEEALLSDDRGIQAQKINMDNRYRNSRQDFGKTDFGEDVTDMESDNTESDITKMEDCTDNSGEYMICLKLKDNRGYQVPDYIELKLIDGYATIGRYDKTGEPCADFNFDYSLTFLSREHIKIEVSDNGFDIIDMNSTNGTLLNGYPLTANNNYELRSGDVIELSRKTRLAYVVV